VSRRIALVRRPSSRIADGIVTYGERAPVDPALAAEQHAAYVEAIAGAGWEIVEVPHDDAQPDSAFVEDIHVCGVLLGRSRGIDRRPLAVGHDAVRDPAAGAPNQGDPAHVSGATRMRAAPSRWRRPSASAP
jgi:hypothetical protein